MNRRRAFSWLAFSAVAVAIAWSLAGLVRWRLERGDVYPPGSSLRADPLGAKALAASFESLPGVSVERNYRPWNRADLPAGATLYVLHAEDWHGVQAREQLLAFVSGGGRLVWALNGSAWHWEPRPEPDEAAEDHAENGENTEPGDAAEEDLPDFWPTELLVGKETVESAERATSFPADAGLSPSIRWDSPAYFPPLEERWQTVYATANGPVAVRRQQGRGEIILLTDSKLFSNEALLLGRETPLLAWTLGGAPVAIFDEWHLGVREPQGVALLMRRYRLGGLTLGLLLAVALFVWSRRYALLPPVRARGESEEAVVRLGGDAQSGLRVLLRRVVSPANLPAFCFQRFAETPGAPWRKHPRWPEARREIESLLTTEAALPARKRRPAETVRRIRAILSERNIRL